MDMDGQISFTSGFFSTLSSHEGALQWNLCIKDTLGPTKSVHAYYQGVLIFQVSLYDKVPFGTRTTCVEYAGVPIFKCRD